MRIAVDAAGGEYAPREIIKGAIMAAQEYEVNIVLVGNRTLLHVMAGKYLKKLNLSIIDANQVIDFYEHLLNAVRSKPDSSIVVGINLVKDGKADAFVSAGNTGAVLCAAFLNLGKIEGVERPALGTVINLTPSAPVFLVDAGANADCRPKHLLQFAQLGSFYTSNVLGINTPRIGLLSNGTEDTKGNHLIQETHKLLRNSGLNFIGNIEGIDIARGTSDVIITDGLTGNIVIKTIEGLGDSFIRLRRQPKTYIGVANHLQGHDLLTDVRFGNLVNGMDYREYGGACLLGVNGNVIVSHGRSQAKAIRNAIGLAKRTAKQDICQLLVRELEYDRKI